MAHAKLTRISNVPETSILPRVVELPPIGDAAAVTTFGRHPDNDVRLDCAIVPSLLSRRHAEIVFDRATGAHFVKDKNSLNGTYVNGNLIPPGGTSLNGGDIIGFGGPATVRRDDLWFRNSLRFVYTPDPTRSVPPPISRDRVVTRSRARELARVVPPISGDRAPELARSASSVSRHHAITRSRSRARARGGGGHHSPRTRLEGGESERGDLDSLRSLSRRHPSWFFSDEAIRDCLWGRYRSILSRSPHLLARFLPGDS